MIIHYIHLQPQYKYESFHIYFTFHHVLLKRNIVLLSEQNKLINHDPVSTSLYTMRDIYSSFERDKMDYKLVSVALFQDLS